jgi:hypothetical protein
MYSMTRRSCLPPPRLRCFHLSASPVSLALVAGTDLTTPAAGRDLHRCLAGTAELFLWRNVVQAHGSHILAKLGARSRAEIMREAAGRPAALESGSACAPGWVIGRRGHTDRPGQRIIRRPGLSG